MGFDKEGIKHGRISTDKPRSVLTEILSIPITGLLYEALSGKVGNDPRKKPVKNETIQKKTSKI